MRVTVGDRALNRKTTMLLVGMVIGFFGDLMFMYMFALLQVHGFR